MEAGKLNCRIAIQAPSAAQDGAGQPLASWSDVATVWANIAHKSGLETIKAGAPVSVVQASIRIRYRTDINAGMRVLYGTTQYDIRAVLPDNGRREFTDLVCETGARR